MLLLMCWRYYTNKQQSKGKKWVEWEKLMYTNRTTIERENERGWDWEKAFKKKMIWNVEGGCHTLSSSKQRSIQILLAIACNSDVKNRISFSFRWLWPAVTAVLCLPIFFWLLLVIHTYGFNLCVFFSQLSACLQIWMCANVAYVVDYTFDCVPFFSRCCMYAYVLMSNLDFYSYFIHMLKCYTLY